MADKHIHKGGLALTVGGAVLATPCIWLAFSLFFPQLLAFPYRRTFFDTEVYSTVPIADSMGAVLAKSDALLKASAIYAPVYSRKIFLTNGDWRWSVLSFHSDAFALSRPPTNAVYINRIDIAHDRVMNGARIAGMRSLSGVIAHERTHALIRAHFGPFADRLYPTWVREGYCDFVAGGGSLTDAEATRLKANHQSVPALPYYEGRKRVEAILKQNGDSVDQLFARAIGQ